MARIPDSYVARISGTFEILDGTDIDVDDEITLECKVLIQEVGLRGMRDGSLRMAFVCKPVGVRVVAPTLGEQSWVEIGGVMMTEAQFSAARKPLLEPAPPAEPEPGRRERSSEELPDGPPRGVRISSVQERSNVAGSSQADRDPVLARFLDEPGE